MKNRRNFIKKALAICTTLFWGIPALYVIVVEIIMICHKHNHYYPGMYFPDIICIFGSLVLIGAIIFQWRKDITMKLAANIILLIFSLVLVPLFLLACAAGHQPLIYFYISLFYPAIGIILSVWSIINCSRNRKRDL